MLINRTYFVGELNITPKDETLDWFINKYEPEFLSHALGVKLYADFKSAINASPSPVLSQIWIDIRDGVEYENRLFRTVRWDGLVQAGPRSPIANYVYFKYMKNAASQTTSMGEKIGAAENATHVHNNEKMISAWNEMCDWVYDLRAFIDHKGVTIYTSWNRSHTTPNLFKRINAFGL